MSGASERDRTSDLLMANQLAWRFIHLIINALVGRKIDRAQIVHT